MKRNKDFDYFGDIFHEGVQRGETDHSHLSSDSFMTKKSERHFTSHPHSIKMSNLQTQ